MRIALYHNIPSGGAKRAVFEWTRRLAKEHMIDVYSLSTADHTFCDIRPFAQNHKIIEFAPNRLFRSPFGRLNQLQRWRDLDSLDHLSRQIAVEINTGGYDILFANTCMFTFIPILLQYIEIPSVYFLHEPFGRSFTRHFDRPYLITNTRREWLNRYDPLINLYHRRLDTLQKNSVRNTGRLLANSNFTRELTQKAFGIETPVCSYGVDLSSFDIENGMQKENIVISVGELSPRKGFDFVVKSLGQIPNEYRPPLIVACNSVIPQERAYVEGLAAQYGVDLQVLTHLGTGELRQLYNRARLCAYAPVLEPFGLVPLEAMACGTPVVGVREGGVQESIVHQRTGLLVERDPVEFGAAVEYLLENQDIAEEYGRNGREHVLNNWTWERSVDELGRHLLDCSNPT